MVLTHDFIDLISALLYVDFVQDVGVDVRHGGASVRQLGSAAAHCRLDPSVSFLVKQLCGQEIYRYPVHEQTCIFFFSREQQTCILKW